MKYEEINTPMQLLDFMNDNIKYGFVDDNKKVYGGSNEDEFENGCRTKWKLSNPDRLLNVKYGHCWDQVELERDWFLKHGYNFKTLYIWFELPYDNTYSTHTYLVFEDNNKWYYFENSDSKNRGIYSFNSYEDAISYQLKKHIESNSKRNPVGDDEISSIKIYEYDKPQYGCNMDEFINHVLENGKEINIKNLK